MRLAATITAKKSLSSVGLEHLKRWRTWTSKSLYHSKSGAVTQASAPNPGPYPNNYRSPTVTIPLAMKVRDIEPLPDILEICLGKYTERAAECSGSEHLGWRNSVLDTREQRARRTFVLWGRGTSPARLHPGLGVLGGDDILCNLAGLYTSLEFI